MSEFDGHTLENHGGRLFWHDSKGTLVGNAVVEQQAAVWKSKIGEETAFRFNDYSDAIRERDELRDALHLLHREIELLVVDKTLEPRHVDNNGAVIRARALLAKVKP